MNLCLTIERLARFDSPNSALPLVWRQLLAVLLTAAFCSTSAFASVAFSDDFSTDKGWTLGTNWERGSATASSGQNYGFPDPAADHTATADNFVLGARIGGNVGFPDGGLHGFFYAVSPVINLSNVNNTELSFWRWLNSDYTTFMQNRVDVWDGATWVGIFVTGGSPGVQDTQWTNVIYDVSSYADGNPNFQVRIGYNVGAFGVYTVSGWNIDDFQVAGDVPEPATLALLGVALAGLGFSRRPGPRHGPRRLRRHPSPDRRGKSRTRP